MPWHSRLRSTSGQAGVETTVLVALVATVLGVGAASASGAGREVASTVSRGFSRALCVVGSGDCDRDREPCVVAARATRNLSHLNAVVFRIGGERVVIVQERSDGSFAVTRTRDVSGGLDFGVGADATVKLGKHALALGGTARAAVLAHSGKGATWVVRSRTAADALVKQLSAGRVRRRSTGRGRLPSALPGDALPEPRERYGEAGWSVTLDGHAGVVAGEGALRLTAKDVRGSRVDRTTGHRTVYLARSNEARLALAAASAGGIGAGGGGDIAGGPGLAGMAGGRWSYAVEFDRDGRPVDLALVQAGAFSGAAELPAQVQPVADLLAGDGGSERLQETEQHLDLTVGENRRAAQDFLRQITSPSVGLGGLVRASEALERRLELDGTTQARAYAVQTSAYGAGGHLAAAIKVGGDITREQVSSRLVSAMSRGRDGAWTRRTDCVGEPRA
jgi:hypothetical protein